MTSSRERERPEITCVVLPPAGTSARCGHYVAFTKLKGTDDGTGAHAHAPPQCARMMLRKGCAHWRDALSRRAGNEVWVELNDGAATVSGPPMTAERAIGNKKCVLLWYARCE